MQKREENISIIKEACVETVSEAVLAEQRGAQRIELCSSLLYGGLTPPTKTIEKVIKSYKGHECQHFDDDMHQT